MSWARGVTAAFVFSVVTIACGHERPEIDPMIRVVSHASGSRLRARVLHAGDVRQFLGWWDTKLGTACAFGTAEDGHLRCIPSGVRIYAQPFCDEQVIALPNSDQAPATCSPLAPPPSKTPYAIYVATENCAEKSFVYAIGDSTAAPRCPGPHPREGTYDPHMSTHVAPTDFVAGYVEQEDRGGRIAVNVITADDGAREVRASFRDTQRNEDCTPTGPANRCVTDDVAFLTGRYFSDKDCSPASKVAYWVPGCTTPKLVVSDEACHGILDDEFFAVGAPVSTPVMESSGGACVPETSGQPGYGEKKVFAPAGAPIPPSTFESLATTKIGSGRIRLDAWSDAAGHALATQGALDDVDFGGTCTAQIVGGVLRCVPSGIVQASSSFADAACTQPLVLRWSGDACDAAAPRPIGALVAADRCAGEIHDIGETYTGPTYAKDATGNCREEATALGFTLLRVGAPAAPERLAEIVLEQE